MKVGDIMAQGAATIRFDAELREAAKLMVARGLRGLPVVNETGCLVGMLSQRDLLRRPELGTEQRRPRWIEFWLSADSRAKEFVRTHGQRVFEVMSSNPISVGTETPLIDVVDLMERHGFKRLPVVREGLVVGIVSQTDLVRALARRLPAQPGEAPTDQEIRNRVLEEFKRAAWLANCAPEIFVRKGVVELHGVVKSDVIRDALRVAAENVEGVRRVENFIELAPLVPGMT